MKNQEQTKMQDEQKGQEGMGTTEYADLTELEAIGARAVEAKYMIQRLTSDEKERALLAAAEGLMTDQDTILKANHVDVKRAEEGGMHPGMVDRLRLTEKRVEEMAEGLLQVAKLPDPIGKILERMERPNGLVIQKRRVPIGVVGMIFESRPNVTADAFGLCFRSGNAVILKGGSDAIDSNMAITASLRKSLKTCGVTEDAVQLIMSTDRKVTAYFMKMNRYVDVLIPRGGAGLIRSVVDNSTIPVIETGTGNCHFFVDETADIKGALDIINNAKTQRIGVCNACESLVVHEKIAAKFLPLLAERFFKIPVEIRGDERVLEILPQAQSATEEDYAKEYLDYIISIKIVSGTEEAISHINKYNTGHSDAILTGDDANARKFLNEIDSACVYVNASTRFTDGFEFGFGAEIGISTQKLHARGPMGLKELTSYKYTIEGQGQVRP